MDLKTLIELFSKIYAYLRSHLTVENIKKLAIAAAKRAFKYAAEHPYQTAFIAINIVLIPVLGKGWLTAGLLKAIGFGALGPIAGSIASWYQSTFLAGYIPADSIFAFLQHLAMFKP